MATWFECKVKYDKQAEDGEVKSVSEYYLIETLTFQDAEEKALKICAPMSRGELNVEAVKKVKIEEIFNDPNVTDYYWYKAKIQFESFNEETKRKMLSVRDYYAPASDIASAVNFFEGAVKTVEDKYIIQVTRTKINEVIAYQQEVKE